MSLRRGIRVMVWGAAALFMFALGLRDLQFDRRLDVVAQPDRATSYLSTLGPPVRVVLSSDRATVVGEPVYVNLRIPRWFRRATVELEYENPSELPLKVGVRSHPAQWAFHFPDPEPHPLSLPLPTGRGENEKTFSTPSSSPSPDDSVGAGERGGGPRVLRVPFELQRAWQVERNVYRFVLSAPGVSVEQPIVIRGLRVTAEREPVCIGRFCV